MTLFINTKINKDRMDMDINQIYFNKGNGNIKDDLSHLQ